MQVIDARNVNHALPEGIRLLNNTGILMDTRAGQVLKSPWPVTTMYRRPTERVLFDVKRDANPFFHLFESLWMLAGRNDVKYVANYVKRMETFSDDGKTLHGAYGYRWRRHFDMEGGGHPNLPDQLDTIVGMLAADPNDRRAVLTMWDPVADLGRKGKDLPCNTHVYFSRANATGALDMTVCCRSNDLIWGAYGANAVHFSILQEYMAGRIDCQVGTYWQVSNNFHGYLETLEPLQDISDKTSGYRRYQCPYMRKLVAPFPLMSQETGPNIWGEDLSIFMAEGPIVGFREPFFLKVVTPMHYAHAAYKKKDYEGALEIAQQMVECDWKWAVLQWFERRQKAAKRAADDGVHS